MSYDPRGYSADYERFLGALYDHLGPETGAKVVAEFMTLFDGLQPAPVAQASPAVADIMLRGRIAPANGTIADFYALPRALRAEDGHVAVVEGETPETDYSLSLTLSGAPVGSVLFPAGQRDGVVTLTEADWPGGVLRLVGGVPDQRITHFQVVLACSSST